MTELNTGVQGAKRQTWRNAHPRKILVELMESNPAAGIDELRDMIVQRVRDDDDLLVSILDYWVANTYRLLNKAAAQSHPADTVGAATLRDRFASIVKRHASVVLMELKLPNGKTVGDCTAQELNVMAPLMGEWLDRVAAKVGAGSTVRQRLNESDLAKIYDAASI